MSKSVTRQVRRHQERRAVRRARAASRSLLPFGFTIVNGRTSVHYGNGPIAPSPMLDEITFTVRSENTDLPEQPHGH